MVGLCNQGSPLNLRYSLAFQMMVGPLPGPTISRPPKSAGFEVFSRLAIGYAEPQKMAVFTLCLHVATKGKGELGH